MAMTSPTTITLNGTPHTHEAAIPITELLEKLGFYGKPVVVELNEQAVFPRDYGHVIVEPGARVEIVALAAGG